METKSLRGLHFGYPISPIQKGHAFAKQNSPRSVKPTIKTVATVKVF